LLCFEAKSKQDQLVHLQQKQLLKFTFSSVDTDGYLLTGLDIGSLSENPGGLYSYVSGASGPGKGKEFALEVSFALDMLAPFCGFAFA
jgi:hypothetical protein